MVRRILFFQEASRQRLIYAGHCLQDGRTLRSVFENRPEEEVRVLHLVCPPKEYADFGLRKRKTQRTGYVETNINVITIILFYL